MMGQKQQRMNSFSTLGFHLTNALGRTIGFGRSMMWWISRSFGRRCRTFTARSVAQFDQHEGLSKIRVFV